jgi:mono/diheme cytochrome c family protein
MRLRAIGLVVAIAVAFGGLVACAMSPAALTPTVPAAETDVSLAAKTVWAGSYKGNIQPIFNQYCVPCHGLALSENGLRLDTYENVMKGTQFGPVIAPASPSRSTLVSVITGTADPKLRMPHQAQPLTRNRIQNIVLWVEAGAPND